MKTRSQGFTLMELMLVIALAALILGIGAPSFREFLRNSRMVTIANDFLGGVQTARTEAIKRQLPVGGVAVCPSDNPGDANATCLSAATRQFNGWIAFVDTNNNCVRDPAIMAEILVRTGPRIDLDNTAKEYRKSVSNGSCISFGASGFMRTDTGRQAATRTLFCDDRGNTKQGGTQLSIARGIDLTATGRARITRDVTELSTWPVSCP